MIVPLPEIVLHPHARGPWCKTPYHGHPNGCPNILTCIPCYPNFKSIFPENYTWFAVVHAFDLREHAEKMKKKHPAWTERQCRNPLYWQGHIMAELRAEAHKVKGDQGGLILYIPEATGVEVFETMKGAGIVLERDNPQIVKKVMLVGIRNKGGDGE